MAEQRTSVAETAPLTAEDEKDKLQADGMPDMSAGAVATHEESLLKQVMSSMFMPVPLSKMMAPIILLTFGIAVAIHTFGSTEKYQKNIDARGEDAAWTFLGAVVFSRLTLVLNFFPMVFKKQIMKGSSKNLRTNMSIHKAIDSQGNSQGQAIVMVQEGAVGQYNRANRSLTHFVETVPSVLITLPLVASVFPFPSFVLTVIYSCGRVMHQRGEAKGYGSHGAGFGIAMVTSFVLEGLCIVCACKAFGWSISLGDFDLL